MDNESAILGIGSKEPGTDVQDITVAHNQVILLLQAVKSTKPIIDDIIDGHQVDAAEVVNAMDLDIVDGAIAQAATVVLVMVVLLLKRAVQSMKPKIE